MKFKQFFVLFLVLILGFLLVSSVSASDSDIIVSSVSTTDYTDMVQYDDYLFGIDYSKIDYNVGNDYYNNTNFTQGNDACSAFSKGGMVGRSYDWAYDDMASIVVRVSDAKYKNIGIAGRLLNQEDCFNIMNNIGDYDYKLEVLPFCLLDGMNEKGVYCNNNMVPGERDGDKQNGRYARAAKETKVIIDGAMLPRFILDNFASAKEAAEYIRDYCDVYNKGQVEIHTLISDSSGDCYVLEYFDNKTWLNEGQIAMTNFYVTGVKFNKNGTVPTALTNERNVTSAGNLTPHSHGLERYNIIINDYDNLNTVGDFWNTLHKLRFTNSAFSTNPIWASDVIASPDTIDSSLDVAEKGRNDTYNDVINRVRGDGNTWQSLHQCVYDLNNLVLYVETQEKNGYHTFKLNKTPVTITIDPIKGKVGEKVKVTATVIDEDKNPILDGEVIFELNGEKYIASIKDGIATTYVILPDNPGNYTLTAYYAGNGVYQDAYDVFIVELTAKDIPSPNPNNNPIGNMENTGNPLLVLLIALGAVGLESLRRKL